MEGLRASVSETTDPSGFPAEDAPTDYDSTLEPLNNEPGYPFTLFLEKVSLHSIARWTMQSRLLKTILLLTLFILYNAYLLTAIAYHRRNATDFAWCEGLGFLIVTTGLLYTGVFYYHVVKPLFIRLIKKNEIKPNVALKMISLWYIQLGAGLLVLAGILAFIIVDTKDNRPRLISTLGLPVLILIGVLLSKHPGRIRWRHIFWGCTLQFIFGLLVLRWETGRDILQCISDKVATYLGYTTSGSSFVYGFLATGLRQELESGEEVVIPAVFFVQALSAIYFFSFCISILYHYGTMTWIVAKMGWLLEVTVGTTAAESICASANIFLGQSEAPLVVKPYVSKMTNSEIHSAMTGGFATVAGTVLGAYISFGVSSFHLLSASLMSAPAALAFAKLLYPETRKSATNSRDVYNFTPENGGNALDAGSRGASQAVFLVGNIIASLVAITAVVAFLDAVISWFGLLVGLEEMSFHWLVSKIFTPLAWVIGVDNEEVEDVAYLLGIKTVINEFVAYEALVQMMPCLSPRSVVIATYGLCSFANFSSIGIQLGAFIAICPERSRDFAKVVFSAFLAGNAAALMTACVAGTLSQDAGYSEWNATSCPEGRRMDVLSLLSNIPKRYGM